MKRSRNERCSLCGKPVPEETTSAFCSERCARRHVLLEEIRRLSWQMEETDLFELVLETRKRSR
jgi:predicted nucleic acid-binding Zn ribbon protein